MQRPRTRKQIEAPRSQSTAPQPAPSRHRLKYMILAIAVVPVTALSLVIFSSARDSASASLPVSPASTSSSGSALSPIPIRSATLNIPPAGPPASQVAPDGEELRIAVADLKDGQARFYEHHPQSGPTIRFFAIRTAVGVYEVALNGCKCCHLDGQGYVQQGVYMVCRKCGESTPIAQIGKIPLAQIVQAPGGCHPFPIPRTVTAEHLVVSTRALEEVSGKAALEEMSRKGGSAVLGQSQ